MLLEGARRWGGSEDQRIFEIERGFTVSHSRKGTKRTLIRGNLTSAYAFFNP